MDAVELSGPLPAPPVLPDNDLDDDDSPDTFISGDPQPPVNFGSEGGNWTGDIDLESDDPSSQKRVRWEDVETENFYLPLAHRNRPLHQNLSGPVTPVCGDNQNQPADTVTRILSCTIIPQRKYRQWQLVSPERS